jgi:hypothetical protein
MIVEHSDLVRDLKFWETLSVSSLMLRPYKVIHNEDWYNRDSEMQEAVHQNRVSGLSFALLTSANQKKIDKNIKIDKDTKGTIQVEMPERFLYRNILGVTSYHSRGLRLIDYEDTDIVVNEQFDKFANIYRPYIKEIEPFKEYVKLLEPESAIPITSEAKHQGKILFVRIILAFYSSFRVTL